MTIDQTYTDFTEQLKKIYEAREANNIAGWIFESVAGIKRLERVTNKNNQLTNSTIEQLNFKLGLLLQHKPVQYVLNEAWFYKMKLFVNEHVLIPRPETEELVEWIVEELKMKNEKLKILDIGTGSGCISIALKKELARCEIASTDVSKEALQVAKQNALNQKTDIEFILLDFLDEKKWSLLPSANIIVSNPPYIPENEKSKLNKNVSEHEPHLALFVKDSDHFVFYNKIALFSQSHLKENGNIFVEVHEDYAEKVKDIFTQHEFKSEIKKDLHCRDRMIKASFTKSNNRKS